MSFKLPNDQIVSGEGYTVVNGMQYPLNRMSPLELANIGVTVYEPPVVTFNPDFYVDAGGGVITPRPIADIKQTLKSKVAAERWARENIGVKINGFYVPTDMDSRNILLTFYVIAKWDATFNIPNFKVRARTDPRTGIVYPAAYVNLSNATIINVARKVNDYINSLFNQNSAIDTQIDAITTVANAEQFNWVWTG